MAKLTKNQQIFRLKKLFRSQADLFDFESHVDGRLSYTENKRIILAKAKRRGITSTSRFTFKGSSLFLRDKAETFQSGRTKRARASDGSWNSKKIFNDKSLTVAQFHKWKRNPRRYDIIGIDSKGSYSAPRREKRLTVKQISKIDIL